MFELLFKYSPVVYQNGSFSFRYLPAESVYFVLILLLLAAGLVYAFRRTIAPVAPRLRIFLISLRVLVFVLLLLMLAEPYVRVTTVIPKRSSVLILVDNSASMGLRDGPDGMSRIATVQKWLGDGSNEGVLSRLRENFNVMLYGFGETLQPLQTPQKFDASGHFTNLAAALKFAEQQVQAQRVSAVVLVSDGVHVVRRGSQNDLALDDPLQNAGLLRRRGVPVYTVGVGSEIETDVALTHVASAPTTTDENVDISLLIRSRTGNKTPVTVEIREDGRLVKSEKVQLQGEIVRHKMTVRPTRKGFLHYAARVIPSQSEPVPDNNVRSFLVNNEEKTGKILYIEELHPWDFKFIRRALVKDKNLKFVSMVLTGNGFYRQGVSDRNELADGFPKTRTELFKYDALFLGSIESSVFSTQQLRLIREFVSVRGGGLIMLAGPKFSTSNWEKTPVADVLPVELLPTPTLDSEGEKPVYHTRFKLSLTPDGYRSELLQLDIDPEKNRELWDEMPELIGYYPVGAARPGATVLATHPLGHKNDPKIIMAWQRYGRGNSMIMASSSSWRWRMQLPSTDNRHARIWRQIARWLAFSAPQQIAVSLDTDVYTPGEKVPIYIAVRDSSFRNVEKAQVSVQITVPRTDFSLSGQGGGDPPVGTMQTLTAHPDLENPGTWRAEYTPQQEGLYQIEVLAHTPSGAFLGHDAGAFLVNPNTAEFRRPDINEAFLRRVAEVTGGRYQPVSAAADLADALSVAKTNYSRTEERDVQDAPFLYGLIALLLAVEWAVRRARGLS